MELAVVIVAVVAGLLIVGGVAVVLKLISALDKSHERLIENNTSFKEQAKHWSVHAMSHTEIDLAKFELLVDGLRNDVGDVAPRATFIPNRAPQQPSDSVTANFNERPDPMG